MEAPLSGLMGVRVLKTSGRNLGSPSRCWQEFRCSGRFFRPVGPNCDSQGQAKRRPWKTRFLAAQALKERADRRADSVCPYRADNEGWNGFQGPDGSGLPLALLSRPFRPDSRFMRPEGHVPCQHHEGLPNSKQFPNSNQPRRRG